MTQNQNISGFQADSALVERPVIAVVMAGGRGTRMGRVEKPLAHIFGRPMLSYIIDALAACGAVAQIDFVTSVHTQGTADYLERLGFRPFKASGSGFINDLKEYLVSAGQGRFIVVSCDIPALRPVHLATALHLSSNYSEDYLMFVVPYEMVKGLSSRPTIIHHEGIDYQPAGLRFIRKSGDSVPSLSDPRIVPLPFRELGVNVNTLEDVGIAESFLRGYICCNG